MNTKRTVTIVGAGMGGSLMALYLAKLNFEVELYELRDNVASLPCVSTKSINQSLSARGIKALEEIGLWETVRKLASPEHGRVVHEPSGELLYQPYGDKEGYIEWSINRNDLNRALQDEFKNFSITLHNEEKCVGVDLVQKTIELEHQQSKEKRTKKVSFLIGADGIYSAVRKALEQNGVTEASIEYLDWGYKNIALPKPHCDEKQFRNDAFHLWSKKKAAIFGLSNTNGYFTCTVTLPLEGPDSFETITTTEELTSFFERYFPDLACHVPIIADEFLAQPSSPFASVYADRWFYNDFCVLLGDAAHAVTVFYGQGINAAFEDCRVLASNIDAMYPDLEMAFRSFQKARKTETDVLAAICKERFIELKDRYESPYFIAHTFIFRWLERLFPSQFHSLYTLVVHSTMPYSAALGRYTEGRRLARLCGVEIVIALGALWVVMRQVTYRLFSILEWMRLVAFRFVKQFSRYTLRKN